MQHCYRYRYRGMKVKKYVTQVAFSVLDMVENYDWATETTTLVKGMLKPPSGRVRKWTRVSTLKDDKLACLELKDLVGLPRPLAIRFSAQDFRHFHGELARMPILNLHSNT